MSTAVSYANFLAASKTTTEPRQPVVAGGWGELKNRCKGVHDFAGAITRGLADQYNLSSAEHVPLAAIRSAIKNRSDGGMGWQLSFLCNAYGIHKLSITLLVQVAADSYYAKKSFVPPKIDEDKYMIGLLGKMVRAGSHSYSSLPNNNIIKIFTVCERDVVDWATMGGSSKKDGEEDVEAFCLGGIRKAIKELNDMILGELTWFDLSHEKSKVCVESVIFMLQRRLESMAKILIRVRSVKEKKSFFSRIL
jgi:hypothetical protein